MRMGVSFLTDGGIEMLGHGGTGSRGFLLPAGGVSLAPGVVAEVQTPRFYDEWIDSTGSTGDDHAISTLIETKGGFLKSRPAHAAVPPALTHLPTPDPRKKR